MISTGWFVVAGILGFVGLTNLVFLDDRRINQMIPVSIVISCVVAVIFCVVMGFHAPDKMPVEYRNVEPDKKVVEKMVEEIVKKHLENMSVEQKYEIMSKMSK